MGHKLQATLHHLLLQMQTLPKYDSICFMLQDLHSRQSNAIYNLSGLPDYVEELAAEWPEYSGFTSYPIRPTPHITTYSGFTSYPTRPAPYITTCGDVREGFWAARRTKTPVGGRVWRCPPKLARLPH